MVCPSKETESEKNVFQDEKSGMKQFIVDFGKGLIDFSAWLILFVIILGSIIIMTINFPLGIVIMLVGLIAFVIVYFLLYLAININDNLTEINAKLNSNR